MQHQQLLDHDRGPVAWAIDVSSDEAMSGSDSPFCVRDDRLRFLSDWAGLI